MSKEHIIEKEFIIDGMSCAACSAAVERVTRKIDGVEQSDVNLTTNRMHIVFDDSKITDDMIIEKVAKAGFGCKNPTQKKEATAKTEINNEHKNEKRNLIAAWVLGLSLMYVAMGHMAHLPLPSLFEMSENPVNFALLQLLLTIPILYIGKGFFIRGFKAFIHLNPNMDSLIAMGSTVAFVYSLALTFFVSANHSFAHELFYEAAGIVLVFVMTGKYLESRSKEKTKGAITALMSLTPDTAFVVVNFESPDETIIEKSGTDIKIDDIIAVKPGERIVSDGIIIKGFSAIDESMLTGESLPVEKKQGDSVIGGSINSNGLLYIKITKIGEDTTLAKIIQCVEEAQGKKAPISKIADKVSGVFVPTAMGIAVLAGIIWAISGADIAFIIRVVTSVLVIACPCALGLATPAAIMTGTGLGALNGILIRSGESLERAKHVDVVVLDKTGTVTQGKPSVKNVFLSEHSNLTKDELLCLTAVTEQASSHPLAQAFSKDYVKNNEYKILSFENIAGKGIIAEVEHKKSILHVLIGGKRLMEEHAVSIDTLQNLADTESIEGGTPVYIAIDNVLAGLISIADSIKPTAVEAVQNLKNMKLKVILLTGDNAKTAQYIGNTVQADEIISEVLPQDKAQVIQNLQAQGSKVMMVGDGINDAPALIQADVGAAIGNGSDIAIESGDIVLAKGDLRDISKAIKLSRLTIRNIKQNLFWAFCYNTIGIPLAAGILYPFYGILLTPMFASFAMSLSSVCVVSNALRLRTKKL
ncbi:MAG: heavy metal translocating P-type ATPase [Spirochaetales bacterium]